MFQATFEKKTFLFKRPGGTSRGVLTEKHAWFITLTDAQNPGVQGIGECSIIPGLSPDFTNLEAYEAKVKNICKHIDHYIAHLQELEADPSILFGVETALLDLQNGGKALFFDTPFTRGESRIPVNGLIWMGSESFMQEQIEEKLQSGYSCIKLKIGSLDFEVEYVILEALRNRYATDKLSIRVDANGAFSVAEAEAKLEKLALLDIHSIEQPIRAGQISEMHALCRKTPVPIALDEELIGIFGYAAKKQLLESILPQYIILKPSLHGGFSGCREWIEIATALHIDWWMTSALESNVGLNAIAQFTSTFDNPLPQGLGTGALYVENTPSELHCEAGFLEMLQPD
jgi:o-succinylbenzoate synthase